MLELFIIVVALAIYFAIRSTRKDLVYRQTQGVEQGKKGELQAKQHGHRCYIEGLSPAERQVVDALSHGLNPNDYFIFSNLILPSTFNGSTQVDHIVVSKYGIFVIESKDYSGWIFGRAHDEKWTQSLPGANKYRFPNPLRQNWGHIKTLENLMPLPEKTFISIVVFSDKSDFKTPQPLNVIHLQYLTRYIKAFATPVLQDRDLMLAIGKLAYLCQVSDISIEDHIRNMQKANLARVSK